MDNIIYKNALGSITKSKLVMHQNAFQSQFKNNDVSVSFDIDSVSEFETKKLKMSVYSILILTALSFLIFIGTNYFGKQMTAAIYMIIASWSFFIYNTVLKTNYLLQVKGSEGKSFYKKLNETLYVDYKILKEEYLKVKNK